MRELEGDRFSLVSLLKTDGLVGIELGVASGDFSKRMVECGRFKHFFGIDIYADHHDTQQYIEALSSIGIFSNYSLFRLKFDEALDLFEDESVDFIYVDGYAHTGEDGGYTISSWLSKVKVGGVISGHDYHSDWPLVINVVNELARITGWDLIVTQMTKKPGPQDDYPSWAFVKQSKLRVELSMKATQIQVTRETRLHDISCLFRTIYRGVKLGALLIYSRLSGK